MSSKEVKIPEEIFIDAEELDASFDNPEDVAGKAKVKLDRRRDKHSTFKRRIKGFLSFLSYFILILSAVMVWWLYNHYSASTVASYHYKRICSLPEESEMVITGERTYVTHAREFLGMKLVDANKATEDTTLKVGEVETTITGVTGTSWWSIHNPEAEPRVINLTKADIYIFTQGDKTQVITYDEFCK